MVTNNTDERLRKFNGKHYKPYVIYDDITDILHTFRTGVEYDELSKRYREIEEETIEEYDKTTGTFQAQTRITIPKNRIWFMGLPPEQLDEKGRELAAILYTITLETTKQRYFLEGRLSYDETGRIVDHEDEQYKASKAKLRLLNRLIKGDTRNAFEKHLERELERITSEEELREFMKSISLDETKLGGKPGRTIRELHTEVREEMKNRYGLNTKQE